MKSMTFFAVVPLAMSLAISAVARQTPSANTSGPSANAWMLTPTPYLDWNKDIATPLRAERDRYWDGVTQREFPLTVKQHDGAFGGSDWEDDGRQPEIPDVPNRVILTATFTASRSVLSASEKSIYTEIIMRVHDVFQDKSGAAHPTSGHDVTLTTIGGTVTLGSGKILSDHTKPSELSLQPRRSYLLALQYHKDGDWFETKEDWDITDGIARANTRRTQYLAKHGRSRLNGVAIDRLGTVLSEDLYADN